MPEFDPDDLATVRGLTHEMVRLSALLDEGLAAMRQFAGEYADAERAYRQEKARAWVTVRASIRGGEKPVSPELQARVDAATADLRRARDLAEGMKVAALESVRSRRGQLSSLQTVANALRSEMDLARTGPDYEP